MRRFGLRLGPLLLALGVFIGFGCLVLPSVSNGRVRLGESVFGLIPAAMFVVLGSTFTILSLVFISRAKAAASTYRAQLESEGIDFFEQDVAGSITYRNFHAPGRYSNLRKVAITSLLILTKKRVIASQESSPMIDVPFTDERIRQIHFSLEGETTLLAAFDANLFHADWSGAIEYRFRTPQAPAFLRKLNESMR